MMRTRPWLAIALCLPLGCGGDVAPAQGTRTNPVATGNAGASGASNVPGATAGTRSAAAGNPSAGRSAVAGAAGPMGGRTAQAGRAPASGEGGAGTAGMPGRDMPPPAPTCTSDAPKEFKANPAVGPGGSRYTDSPRFRVYGNASEQAVKTTLNHLEAAYSCFIESLCFRSTGLAIRADDSPHYKLNVYGVSELTGAAGVMRADERAGLSYLEVVNDYLPKPDVTVHEFGHALAYTEYNWVEQIRTGAWWETVANWTADTYLTSDLCEPARARFGVQRGRTLINLERVLGESHLLIVSTQNYYEAWPLLTYLTNNPDGYPGLGTMAIPQMMRNHPRNNETPLHVLERITKPVTVQTILGRYWARMAYVDIGHPSAQQAFFDQRGRLDFANLEPAGDQTYQVRQARRPQYGGANIIPLKGTGEVTVEVTNLGNGQPDSNFTATLAIRAADGAMRYQELTDGAGEAMLQSDDDATLVVVNTPDTLYQYDAFESKPSSKEATGLDYRVRITGATPAQ